MPRSLPLRLGFTALLWLIAPCVSTRAEDGPGEFHLPDVIPLDAPALAAVRTLVAADPAAAALAHELAAAAAPDLGQPATPLRVIHYEGLLNTDPRRIATVSRLRQMGAAGHLVNHWQASGDPAAAATLRSWIEAWFGTYAITGNDVNENKLVPLLVAYFHLRADFDPTTRTELDRFVAELGSVHVAALGEGEQLTNRFTKHARLAALTGLILERPDWIEASLQGARRFISASLYADGTSADLRLRDTLTYHSSALRPILQIAMLVGAKGRSLYRWENERGGSLARSVDYVVPFALGEQTREEWKNSAVPLDRQRAAAGIGHYAAGRLYQPKQALELMELAAYFDPALERVVLHLTDGAAQRFPTWQTVLNAAVATAHRQAVD